MKTCEKCTKLHHDKMTFSCSACEHRPHDLCCADHFEPAEPKVLSAEEWSKYILTLEQSTQTYKEILGGKTELPPVRLPYIIKRVAKDSFEEGNKNGRLERDLELRSLIDYIKKFTKSLESEGFKNDAARMRDELKNLKPL